jgi:hypothetical protein
LKTWEKGEDAMGCRFVWQVGDESYAPLFSEGDEIEYVEQHPRPGDLALLEIGPASIPRVVELVCTGVHDVIFRDIRTGDEERIAASTLRRASRVVGARSAAGVFTKLGRRWPV